MKKSKLLGFVFCFIIMFLFIGDFDVKADDLGWGWCDYANHEAYSSKREDTSAYFKLSDNTVYSNCSDNEQGFLGGLLQANCGKFLQKENTPPSYVADFDSDGNAVILYCFRKLYTVDYEEFKESVLGPIKKKFVTIYTTSDPKYDNDILTLNFVNSEGSAYGVDYSTEKGACSQGGYKRAQQDLSEMAAINNKLGQGNFQNEYYEVKQLVEDFNTVLEDVNMIPSNNFCYFNVKSLLSTFEKEVTGEVEELESWLDAWAELVDSKPSSEELKELDNLKFKRNKTIEETFTLFDSSILPGGNSVDCNTLLDSDLVDVLNYALNVMMIAVPIVLIVLITIDFATPVISQDQDAIKKASSKALKRLIAAVVIFFIPVIVKALLNMDGIKGIVGEDPSCLVNEVYDN